MLPRVSPHLHRRGDLVVIERDLRNQNDVRAAGDSAMERDPARVTSHHFENHHALVTGGGGVQAIERVCDARDRGIETERHRRGFEIVVDRLRNADAVDAGFLKLQRGRHRAVAADDDQGLDPVLLQNMLRIGDHSRGHDCPVARADLGDEMSAIRRADNGPAARHDSARAATIENLEIAGRQQALESVEKSEHFATQFFRRERDPRRTAFNPGQSPPLVRTPMRGFIS